MKTKKEFLEYMDDQRNFEEFLDTIFTKKHLNNRIKLDSSNDFEDEVFVINKTDYKALNYPICNAKLYQRFNCSHTYDCCGCISSVSVEIVNNKNGYISIFVHTSYNY